MSLTGMMRTSVSGMAAQANRLATVSDNIANAGTTGYKEASTEFSSIILNSGSADYVPGGVETNVRYAISQQGAFQYTTSVTDLAVSGGGFFIVAGHNDAPFLTRAGSFVKDGNGNLVNAAGYTLLGYPITNDDPNIVANGYGGLQPVNIGQLALLANPSVEGTLHVNLPSETTAVASTDLPSANGPTTEYTAKTSLVAYGSLGEQELLDVYYTKIGVNSWEVAVFDRADAGSTGGFPYSSGPLTTATLTFDASTGRLTGGPAALSIAIPNGTTLDLDISQSSQLAADFTVRDAKVDGNAPSEVERIEISDTGVLYAVFENGARAATYRVPLANVTSPDNLQPLAGNVYAPSLESGDLLVGLASTSGFGTIASGALEKSTVDIASELTTMIESQHGYTANSKVFQTGAELMEVLINLRR